MTMTTITVKMLMTKMAKSITIKKIGSFRSYDGNCKERVSLKFNFALS